MNKSLRIALVGPAYPLRGGIAHHTALLARALADRGHSVHFFSLKKQYPAFLFPGRSQRDPSLSPLTFPNRPVLDPVRPWTWLTLARELRLLRPDLAVFAWWNPLFAPAYAALTAALRRARVPSCFLCHNIDPHEPSALGRWLCDRAFRRVERFVVQSRAAQAALAVRLPAARVAYAPHPAYGFFLPRELPDREESRRRLGLPPHSPVLLFFGHVRAYKGLDVLLHALPAAIEREPDCRLLIAGEFYEDPLRYRRLIAELGLSDRVTVLDRYIPDEEVPGIFRAADALVLPYRSASASGPLLTAAAFGLPVVASRVGGLPDYVREGTTGVLVPPENPLALAEGIQKALRLAELGGAAARIRAAAAEWSWDRMAEAVERP